ncbi:lactonase family protein [Petroclostridium sp. X23]|uniref:lactonase family protein n=1 Tax=Petroclostridium sp. X23 TaxID=3045146 RepID=UPI0024AD9B77|nr:lactonase family protein [Petroclostridium sp. X23]WHH60749.1 lactonase family protein [Petroclostridium sp. X23]
MKEHMFYVGTYSEPDEENIILYKADFDNLKFSKISSHMGTPNPSYLLENSNGILYAVEELVSDGKVSAYYVDHDGFHKECTVSSYGADPCHLSMDDKEHFLFAANYTSGSLAMFELDTNGMMLDLCCLKEHRGKGVNPDRQEGPHVHFTKYMKGDLYVCDLGLDTIFCYQLNQEQKKLEETTRNLHVPDGNGPRHLCFHPIKSDWLYVVAELSAQVFVFHLEDDTYVLKQEINSLPDGVPLENRVGAIKFSDDGRYLFVSNRGHDSLTSFAVSDSGFLQVLDVCKTGGKTPRDFTPFGDYFIVANQDSSLLTVLHFDRINKRFKKLSMEEKVGHPVCIIEKNT